MDADFFNTEEKNPFSKYPAACGRSNTIEKRYVWTGPKAVSNNKECLPNSLLGFAVVTYRYAVVFRVRFANKLRRVPILVSPQNLTQELAIVVSSRGHVV